MYLCILLVERSTVEICSCLQSDRNGIFRSAGVPAQSASGVNANCTKYVITYLWVLIMVLIAPQSLTWRRLKTYYALYIASINNITRIVTYKESLESPLVPDNLILNEVVGTAWYSIDSIVATHDAGYVALSHTSLECWEVSLCNLRIKPLIIE